MKLSWPPFKTRSACSICGQSHQLQPVRRQMSYHPDFHLLETLAKPKACVTGSRIAVWVYRDMGLVRAVVVSGHAEARTCASVTSILIEAVKALADDFDWMINSGAGYLRLPADPGQLTPELLRKWQRTVDDMIRALGEAAVERGLVDLIELEWNRLAKFRRQFAGRRGSSTPRVFLPNTEEARPVADYFPIVPVSSESGEELVLRLEGWDFDCPEFQLVADQHLRCVQRELLRDALRRRRTYRNWLREWLEDWVRRLAALPKPEAASIQLQVPPAVESQASGSVAMNVERFLKEQAASFLDPVQSWYVSLANRFDGQPYSQLSEEELDRPVRPQIIKEIDFERGVMRTRDATEADRAMSWRERCSVSDPHMISVCLRYIRGMDQIIRPYEDLRKVGGEGRDSKKGGDQSVAAVAEISQRIVVESMIRGWPSFYLTDERDQRIFDRWSSKYRIHVWSVLAAQVRSAGVDLEALMEDNVVFDVRFDEDLGCTVRPLMLIDEAAHAQVHGSLAGAGVSIALWARQTPRLVPPEILKLGKDNAARAVELVRLAGFKASSRNPDPKAAAHFMRLALACHPEVAGAGILREWRRRLGRSTQTDFKNAQFLLEASEWMRRGKLAQAERLTEAYLSAEPDPVPDALIMLAVLEMSDDIADDDVEDKLKRYRERLARRTKLVERFEELGGPQFQAAVKDVGWEYLEIASRSGIPLGELATVDILRIMQVLNELRELDQHLEVSQEWLKAREERIKAAKAKQTKLMRTALDDPATVAKTHPRLAEAARKARPQLQKTLHQDVLMGRWSQQMFRRYADTLKVVEVSGLLDILDTLTVLDHWLGKTGPDHGVRLEAVKVKRLSQALWLPKSIQDDVKMLADEFEKGAFDRLLRNRLRVVIGSCASACLTRIQDLLADPVLTSVPLKESTLVRIHIANLIEGRYGSALGMLLLTKIPLALALREQVRVLDAEASALSENGRLFFDGSSQVCLDQDGQRKALFRVEDPSPETVQYLSEVFADPRLLFQVNRFAPSLAEGVLALEVKPGPEWQSWSEAMALIASELLTVLSLFGHAVTVAPEHCSPRPRSEFLERMNELEPRLEPLIDWQWNNKGGWTRLFQLPPQVSRVQ